MTPDGFDAPFRAIMAPTPTDRCKILAIFKTLFMRVIPLYRRIADLPRHFIDKAKAFSATTGTLAMYLWIPRPCHDRKTQPRRAIWIRSDYANTTTALLHELGHAAFHLFGANDPDHPAHHAWDRLWNRNASEESTP